MSFNYIRRFKGLKKGKSAKDITKNESQIEIFLELLNKCSFCCGSVVAHAEETAYSREAPSRSP